MDYQKAILDRYATCKKIRALITNSKYTYEELAEMLQLTSPRVIYECVKGKKVPGLENMYNIALIFNIKIEDCLVLRYSFIF